MKLYNLTYQNITETVKESDVAAAKDLFRKKHKLNKNEKIIWNKNEAQEKAN